MWLWTISLTSLSTFLVPNSLDCKSQWDNSGKTHSTALTRSTSVLTVAVCSFGLIFHDEIKLHPFSLSRWNVRKAWNMQITSLLPNPGNPSVYTWAFHELYQKIFNPRMCLTAHIIVALESTHSFETSSWARSQHRYLIEFLRFYTSVDVLWFWLVIWIKQLIIWEAKWYQLLDFFSPLPSVLTCCLIAPHKR